jgi:hypothetical protein
MNGQKPNYLTPALIGGAIAGILSGIPVLNCLCCLWIIGGAIVAAYRLGKDAQTSLTSGDGAIVGAFSGVFGAVVNSLVGIPFQAMNLAFAKRVFERIAEYGQNMPSDWETWFNRGAGPFSVAWFLFGLVIAAAIFAALGALGGIIGVALFGKKTSGTPQAPLPPPPQPATPSQP